MNSANQSGNNTINSPVKKPTNWSHVLLLLIGVVFLIFLFKPSNNSNKQQAQNTVVTQVSTPTKQFTEEERIELAKRYCANRTKSNRYYPLPDIKTGVDGVKEYELNEKLMKVGMALTQTDCRSVIDYLVYFSSKYALVTTVDMDSVIEKKYWIGMSPFELWSSLGYPDKINETNYGLGQTEQYVYFKDSHKIDALYIYVEGTKVTSYQDF